MSKSTTCTSDAVKHPNLFVDAISMSLDGVTNYGACGNSPNLTFECVLDVLPVDITKRASRCNAAAPATASPLEMRISFSSMRLGMKHLAMMNMTETKTDVLEYVCSTCGQELPREITDDLRGIFIIL